MCINSYLTHPSDVRCHRRHHKGQYTGRSSFGVCSVACDGGTQIKTCDDHCIDVLLHSHHSPGVNQETIPLRNDRSREISTTSYIIFTHFSYSIILTSSCHHIITMRSCTGARLASWPLPCIVNCLIPILDWGRTPYSMNRRDWYEHYHHYY